MKEFSKAEIIMLSKEIPTDPCEMGCWLRHNGCLGCTEKKEYSEFILPYKEAGILSYALRLREIRKLQEQIDEKRDRLLQMDASLPKELRTLVRR